MSNEKSAQSELIRRLEQMEARIRQADERAQQVADENAILRRQLEREARVQGNDPKVSAERTREVLSKSMAEQPGKFRWAVRPSGWRYREVEFNCDTDVESAAIAEYQKRFKTDFRRDHAENNHEIRLVGKWVNGQLVQAETAGA